MTEKRQLFDSKKVQWLKVSKRKLGKGTQGTVYFGRLKFQGKKPITVAVKKFENNSLQKEMGEELELDHAIKHWQTLMKPEEHYKTRDMIRFRGALGSY